MTESSEARSLLSLMLAHQRRGWRRGESAPVETYLERQPELHADPETVLDLIYNEIVLRTEVGESPRLEEYLHRFPHLAEPLELQFELEGVFGPEPFPQPDGDDTTRNGLPPPPSPAVRPAIPGYEILGELGRGGMGVVYRARQLRLNRVVALKMILAGDHAAPEAAVRFLGEAEAVARLHHPNVVQVHALGDHEGNPYFEMEYVPGGSLADRLDGTPRPPRESARLIETLARAIHEVHRLGIVHRDLKPANVLLAADGIPKVADFGLAKWLDVESGLTRTDHILGSPSYMAPEQAGGGVGPVGPAADVYALGAILYELLTGRPPFRAATALETLEQVKSVEPVAPGRLRPGLPRDLETICLKCLRKEPARRYESASELAEDLRRFGTREPIRARPVGALERAWRWCRREPVRAGLAAGLVLTLLGGLAGVATQWRRAEENVYRQREANRALGEAYLALREANDREGAARRRAQEQFDAAMKAIRASENLAYGATLRREAHLDGLRRELLQTALGFYRELQESLESDASLEARSQLYAAYSRVASISKEFGLYDEALTTYRRALALAEQMAAVAPADTKFRAARAQCLEWIGGVLNLTGHPAEALRSFEQAREILEPLARDDPVDLRRQEELSWLLANIAVSQNRLGRRADAIRLHEQVLGIREALVDRDPTSLRYRSDLAWCWRELGLAKEAAGDPEAALRPAERAVALLRDVVRSDPGAVDHRHRLAACLHIVGRLLLRSRRPAEAAAPMEQAYEYFEALARDDPSQFRDDLAQSLLYLAFQRMRTDRLGEALTSIRRAEELLDQSSRVSPWIFYNLACAYSRWSAADCDGSTPAPAEREASASRGIAALRRAFAAGFDNLGHMGRDPDLDPLRSRRDFQEMRMDLSFPADPFQR
jgi:tetratricopeptide (TPR) repeat protein/tRNA A-37 threonylcarbamoyl transferase component Bud32